MNRKIVLIASLVAGLLAAVLTSAYISAKEVEAARLKAKLEKEYNRVGALRFTRPMSKGALITAADITNCTTYGQHSWDLVPTNNIYALVGKTTACSIEQDAPIRWAYIEGGRQQESGLSRRIPALKDGRGSYYRAMSINVTGASSVSGLIQKGDFVDVIGTFDFPVENPNGTEKVKANVKRGDPVTCTVLQRVLVLATGNERSADRGLGVTGGSGRNGGYSLVTLAVTPREAEILAFAENIKGRLMLTLRNPNDNKSESECPVITFEKIYDEVPSLNEKRQRTLP